MCPHCYEQKYVLIVMPTSDGDSSEYSHEGNITIKSQALCQVSLKDCNTLPLPLKLSMEPRVMI